MNTYIRTINVGRYKHNNKGFLKHFIFPKSMNRRKELKQVVLMQALWKTIPLVMKSVLEEI